MAENKAIKPNNYFQVSAWMVQELELKGNELMIYAIIYGFSQDGEGRFSGSIRYLTEFTGSSRRSVINNLNSLVDKGYINKDEIEVYGIKKNMYSANLDIIQDSVVVQKVHMVVQKMHGGGAKNAPNNNSNNKDNIFIDVPEELMEAFIGYADMRKKIKKPISSVETVTRTLNKLNNLANTVEEKIEILNQSTDNCWVSVYELKDKPPKRGKINFGG